MLAIPEWRPPSRSADKPRPLWRLRLAALIALERLALWLIALRRAKTEERKAIAAAREERAAKRAEEKRLAAIEAEKRRIAEEAARKQAEIEAKAQAEREHEECVAAMEALELEQKAKRDARYAARKAQKKKGR